VGVYSGAVFDSHVHLWQRRRTPQDWIDPVSMQVIDRDFWFEDLDAVLASNGVTSAVLVQASNSRQETRDHLTADLPASIGAIVGWVDLASADVAAQIAEARALPNGRSLSGIRHLAHMDPDPQWLRTPSVSRGLKELDAAGLSFDLVVTPGQLADCAAVASEHPGLTLVLDHLGKPSLRSENISEWETALRVLAEFPNVYAKLSGLTMEADWESWTVGDIERAAVIALDCFGPKRLMFGSDWPLVELCGGYSAWLSAARTLTSTLSADEQAAIFCHTASSAYRFGRSARG